VTLARELGMSVQQAQDSISSSEFVLWLEYFRLEGTRQQREDLHSAHLLAFLANALGDGKRTFEIADFLLDRKQSTEPTPERSGQKELESAMRAFCRH